MSDPNRPNCGNFDLGPTWFWPQHDGTIAKLINELNVESFVQYTTRGDAYRTLPKRNTRTLCNFLKMLGLCQCDLLEVFNLLLMP
ncbi:hypothetical protein [Gracilibacillus alcaliphilus]|uniref:hypothetical protein n=1 Tax=Gracilibacillus alcaliphilus TaxID=1401441 RepID=UPI0030845F8B